MTSAAPVRAIVSRIELRRAMQLVSRCVARRSTRPIMANAHLELKDGTLILQGTDLELRARVEIAAGSSEYGATFATTVPAHTLSRLAAHLRGLDVLTLEPRANTLRISAARAADAAPEAEATLPTLPAEDFPETKTAEARAPFVLPAATLTTWLPRLLAHASKEEMRYYLNGAFLHHKDGKLMAAAMDGHRLLCAPLEQTLPATIADSLPLHLQEGALQIHGAIVPIGFLQAAAPFVANAGDVSLSFTDHHVNLAHQNISLTGKLIAGKYPNIAAVIPKGKVHHLVQMDGHALHQAALTARAVTDDGGISTPILIDASGGTVRVKAGGRHEDQPSLSLRIPGTCETEGRCGFQARYVAQIMAWLGRDIEMELRERGGPVVFRRKGDSDVLVLLMPMRVDGDI